MAEDTVQVQVVRAGIPEKLRAVPSTFASGFGAGTPRSSSCLVFDPLVPKPRGAEPARNGPRQGPEGPEWGVEWPTTSDWEVFGRSGRGTFEGNGRGPILPAVWGFCATCTHIFVTRGQFRAVFGHYPALAEKLGVLRYGIQGLV